MSMLSPGAAHKAVLCFRTWLRQSLAVLMMLLLVGCEYLPERSSNSMVIDDTPLSLAVARALESDPQTTNLRLTISSPDDGKVRLQGVVGNDGQRVAAEQIASSVDGVKFVINTLYLY